MNKIDSLNCLSAVPFCLCRFTCAVHHEAV